MATNLYKVASGGLPLASDLNQIVDVFNATNDIGAITFAPSISAPNVSLVTTALAAGTSLGVGTYKYVLTFVSGYAKTNGTYVYGGETVASSVITVTTTTGNQAVTFSTLPTVWPSSAVALRFYRTAVGGSTYQIAYTLTTKQSTWTDNVTDASLINVQPPSVNTTGTILSSPTINNPSFTGTGTFAANVNIGGSTAFHIAPVAGNYTDILWNARYSGGWVSDAGGPGVRISPAGGTSALGGFSIQISPDPTTLASGTAFSSFPTVFSIDQNGKITTKSGTVLEDGSGNITTIGTVNGKKTPTMECLAASFYSFTTPASFTTGSTTYFNDWWHYVAANWVNIQGFILEVTMYVTSGGTASIQLYDLTTSTGVGPALTTTATSSTNIRSSVILQNSLTDGHNYTVVFTATGQSCYLGGASLKALY